MIMILVFTKSTAAKTLNDRKIHQSKESGD
jgi:hypothetical protein